MSPLFRTFGELRYAIVNVVPRRFRGHELMSERMDLRIGVERTDGHHRCIAFHRAPRQRAPTVPAERRAEELRAGQVEVDDPLRAFGDPQRVELVDHVGGMGAAARVAAAAAMAVMHAKWPIIELEAHAS